MISEVIGLREGWALREAGVYALATLGLLLAGLYLPFLHFLFGMALLVLTAVTARRRTAVLPLTVLVGCGGGLTFLLSTPGPLITVLEFGFLGLVPALGFKNGVRPEFTLAATLAVSPLFVGLGLALGYYGWKINPLDLSLVATGAGLDTPAGEEALRLLAVLLPGSYAVWAFATALLGFFLSQGALRRRGLAGPRTIPFSRWRLPWYAVWGLIGALGLILAGDQWRMASWANVGKNILFLMFFVFSTGGASLAAHYYGRIGWARPWKLLALGLAAFYWPISFTFLALFGLLDSLVNWRGRPPRPSQKEG